jgi:quercetin dioxygenase-like cupin family protein
MDRNTTILAALASLALLASACGDRTGATTDTLSAVAASAPAAASISMAAPSGDSLTITRAGSRPTQPGPADWFTGTVRIEPMFAATDSSRAAASSVSFEPGARTAWHRHPRGQVLIVTAGEGRVQRRGGPVEEFRTGDVIWTPPGVEHWHGASPSAAMTHLAIYEHVNGNVVTWLEHVTDAEYGVAPRPRTGTP